MTVTANFSLGEVLCNSTIPAVDHNGVAPHYKSGQQAIWTSAGGGGPTIINLSTTDSESLVLTGSCATSLDGKTMTCSSTWEGFTKGLKAPTPTHQFTLKVNEDGTFKVTLPVRGNEVPWGFKGRVTWKFQPTNDPGTTFADYTTDIELYAVSSLCSHPLACDGIPLDFLRFFVLTTRGDGFYVSDFAAHVVTQLWYHSGFTYNTYSGANHYSPIVGQKYSLSRWLKDLDRNKTAVVKNAMNCIDLANVTGMAISLCLKDSADAEALWWCRMNPFGFFKKTLLIGGVEKVNNPFAEGATGEYIGVMDPLDERRRPFKRHWFIIWHGKVYDATSGPQLGVFDIHQYLAEALDPEYDPKYDTDFPSAIFKNGTKDDFYHELVNTVLSGPIPEHEVNTGNDPSWERLNVELRSKLAKLDRKVEIKMNLDTLVGTLNKRCGNEYMIEPAEPYDLDIHSNIPELGLTYSWPIRCTHKDIVGRFDLQITVFDTAKQATDKCLALLASASCAVQRSEPIINGSVIWHHGESPNYVQIFWSYGQLFGNLVSHSHGLREKDVMPVALELQKYLEEASLESHPTPPAVVSGRATTSTGSSLPDTMAVNTAVDVYVEVPPSNFSIVFVR